MGKNKRRNNKNDSIVVRDGFITFHIKIGKELECPCKSKVSPCSHIVNILDERQTSQFVLDYYPAFKQTIAQNIKLSHREFKDSLEEEVDNVLGECCAFCMDELHNQHKPIYGSRLKWAMCEECNKLSHHDCFAKWNERRKDCMYCRYEPPPAVPNPTDIWDLPEEVKARLEEKERNGENSTDTT